MKRSHKQLPFIGAGTVLPGHVFCIHRRQSPRPYSGRNSDMLLWHQPGSFL